MIIDELIAVLGYDLKGEANLARFNQGLQRAQLGAQRLATAIVAAGAVAAGAMVLLGKNVISVSSEFETMKATLTTIEGSADKAQASLDWVQEFAKKTPYDLKQVSEGFVRLRAYGLDPMSGLLESVGNASSAMGKDLMSGVEAIADAAQGENERLKEFGIRAEKNGKKITYSWQQNGKEMTKTVQKNGTEITKALQEIFDQRFKGAMEMQSKTFKGLVSNLGDTWTGFLKKIGEKGFFENVKGRVSQLLDLFNTLDANGTLDRWAQNISDVLVAVANGAVALVTAIGRDLNQVSEYIANFFRLISNGEIDLTPFKAFGIALAILLAVAFPVHAAVVALGLAIDDFLTYLRGGQSVIGDFVNYLSNLGPSFSGIGGKISSAMDSATAAIQSVDWDAAGVAAGKALVAGFKTVGSALLDLLSNIDWGKVGTAWVAAMKAVLQLLLGAVREIAGEIVAAVVAWFDGVDLTEIGTRIAQSLLDGIKAVGGQIRDYMMSLVPQWAVDFLTKKDANAPANLGVKESAGPGYRMTTQQTMAVDQARAGRSFGFGGTTDTMPGKTADDMGVGLSAVIANINAHLAKMTGDAVSGKVSATVTDARQDNRQFPVNTSVVINQTVSGVTAPGAAASAVAGAIQPARIEGSPSY